VCACEGTANATIILGLFVPELDAHGGSETGMCMFVFVCVCVCMYVRGRVYVCV